jgi:hypothetical protein
MLEMLPAVDVVPVRDQVMTLDTVAAEAAGFPWLPKLDSNQRPADEQSAWKHEEALRDTTLTPLIYCN